MARPKRTDEEYFSHYAFVTEHGLEWRGPKNGKYGRMGTDCRMYAHRYSWIRFRGPLEPTDIVDHENPMCPKTCITPGHLKIQKTRTDHLNAGWARGEYANTWSNRKPNLQNPLNGRFVKVVKE